MTETQAYTGVAKYLHWLVAGLIVLQFVLAELAEGAGDADELLRQLALLAHHKSVGLTILLLALVRVGWRWYEPPPPLPSTMPSWQQLASKLSHNLLYVLLFALPVSGWLMSSASAYSVSWFNVLAIPDLVDPDPELKETLETIHESLALGLFLLASLHILAALKHALLDRDGVLARISSSGAVGLGVLVLVAGLFLLRPSLEAPAAGTLPKAEAPAVDVDTNTGDASSLPLWNIDYGRSAITFSAEQAGAEFTGTWTEWQADVRFDPNDLAGSSALVRINSAAVNTQDQDRDETIRSAEFFAAAQFPYVTFRTQSFQATPSGYQAAAELMIKNSVYPVAFDFSVSESPSRERLLQGSARLDRLALQVGTGDWASTEWVGQYVDVHVQVTALAE